jgi:hypothetical protein
MRKLKSKAAGGYKARKLKNGGQDRYGHFSAGRQTSADSIAGRTLWIPGAK